MANKDITMFTHRVPVNSSLVYVGVGGLTGQCTRAELLTAAAGEQIQIADAALTAYVRVYNVGSIDIVVPGGQNIQIGSGANFLLVSSTHLGFFGGAVIQQADPGVMIDATGGVAGLTLAAVAGTGDDADINNNFASLVVVVNALSLALRNYRLTA